MRTLLLTTLVLTACKASPQDGTTPTNDPGTTPATTPVPTPATPPVPTRTCGALIVSTTPAASAEQVPVDTQISIQFNSEVTSADYWTLGVTGVDGTATLAADGMSATFVPDAPLAYETTLAIEAEACQDGLLSTFTTEDRPLLDDDIEGKTYAVAYPNIQFNQPPPAIMDLVNVADWIVVQILDIDDITREFSGWGGAGNTTVTGDPVLNCDYAFDAGTGDFSNNPEVSVGPQDFVIPIQGNDVTIENFQLDGTLAANAESLRDITITGKLDTRGIAFAGDLCFLAALASTNCIQCNDGAPRCLAVNAVANAADWYDTLDIIGACGP